MGTSVALPASSLPLSVVRKPILPDFYGSCYHGYSVNYLNKHFWKFTYAFGDFEDAVSEACLVYYDCRNRYGHTINTPQQFMALFKRMMASYFIDYAAYSSRRNTTLQQYQLPNEETAPDAPLVAALSEASSELQEVLKLVLNAPVEVMQVLRSDAKDARTKVDDFFIRAVTFCNIPPDHAPILEAELRSILT